MDALNILNRFIESGSPPDILSTEWPDGVETRICFSWLSGTTLYLDYDDVIYRSTWDRFQEFWNVEALFTAKNAEEINNWSGISRLEKKA